jgi:hypothetical protein
MTRSKFSTKAVVLATAIGLSTVAFAGSQPAAAQSYTCPAGLAYDPSYGCTLGGDYGYYGYPNVLYGRHPDHGAFDHGFGHGRMGGLDRGMGAGGSIVHHGMGFNSIVGVGHFGGGGFGHGMAGGFGHGGGGGHR